MPGIVMLCLLHYGSASRDPDPVTGEEDELGIAAQITTNNK